MEKVVLELRRSSLISPYGIGSIVPLSENQFYMVAGLDEWRFGDHPEYYEIKEERLCKRLGVKFLRMPPDSDNHYARIPGVRFPNNFYCKTCGKVVELSPFEDIPTCHGSKMIPDRFIVVCPEGHIDDFPISAWIHRKCHKEYNPTTCKITRSFGRSGGLASDVTYTCTCGASGHMAEAMGRNALKRVGLKCFGKRPWLGGNEEECNVDAEKLRVTLRGSTNVWFAITRSSIYIPADVVNRIPDSLFYGLKNFYVSNGSTLSDDNLRSILSAHAKSYRIPLDLLVTEFWRRIKDDNDSVKDTSSAEDISEDKYRSYEYDNLIASNGEDSSEFCSISMDISQYSDSIQKLYNQVTLVPKLRETRAFVGFSRLEPIENVKVNEAKKSLSLEKSNWLPAIAVYGEGIFFCINHILINEWASQDCVRERIGMMNIAYKNNKMLSDGNYDLKPEFVLIHTLAHLIINQLSFECGYGSSSLRERLYCEKEQNHDLMHGVLIYTASGDSEGTLGGLVSQGRPGKLEDIVSSAIENARWCSSDPICIESHGQGPDSCNLAACHNCALLPETSCELGNRLLDRGLLIGTPENPEMGFINYISAKNS